MNIEKLHTIIKSPIVSEKSVKMMESNQYAFTVDKHSTKTEIKQAVEAVFNVKVESLNTVNQKGKAKRTKMRQGKRSDVKKAYITLAPGETIAMIGEES